MRPAASRTRHTRPGQEEGVEVLEDVVPEHISDLVEYGDMASPTPRDYRHARRHALQNQGAQGLRASREACCCKHVAFETLLQSQRLPLPKR